MPGSRVGRHRTTSLHYPVEVQTAFTAVATATSLTITFGLTPRPGNLLVFFLGGHNPGVTPPSGVTGLSGGSSGFNQQVQVYYRRVLPGDGKTWTFSFSSDTMGVYAIEFQDAAIPVNVASQITTDSGTSAIPLLPNSMNLFSPSKVYALVEMDGVPTTIAATNGWMMQSFTFPANHPFWIFRRPGPCWQRDVGGLSPCYSVTGQTSNGTGSLLACIPGLVY